MPNKMLIDASHPEETRVVVTRGNRIEEFDFESQDKKQLKGNIYLARVTRVEPSLQAAFVEYGGNRHGFLAFSEIHPDYYQIPIADRQALLRAEAEEAGEDDEDEDDERSGRNRRRRRGRGRDRDGETRQSAAKSSEDDESADGDAEQPAVETVSEEQEASDEAAVSEESTTSDDTAEDEDNGAGKGGTMAAAIDADVISEEVATAPEETDPEADTKTSSRGGRQRRRKKDDNGDDNGEGGVVEVGAAVGEDPDGEVESVGAEDALEELPNRRRTLRRQYKIQEVIKRRQILLVQVVKEERGNKGAALTTYLSLAGRYSVLMPNTARGGGISRKITSIQDRKRLKEVVQELEVPDGMGVILRTAGANRTKAEIKRDYEYLMRLWENVRTLTLQSTAPALVYEEGSLIKRSVRDLYNKDIDEVLVSGEEGYREAKDFMRMLMPSHAKVVQPYRDLVPIFARSGIEAQLDRMLQPQVTLKSGGYIIINQTEALVSIDVNSGRSTREHSIEDTALQTNLEAAEEVARQLRLRDLAGLIVIDFIDMEEKRNNRAVEKRLKDHLKNDRARIQVGRISHFGLLEMSRQRIRASVLESTTKPCPHCGGSGHVRSDSSVALHVVRGIEEFLLKDNRSHITVKTPVATALYVLNHKRRTIVDLETRFGLTITMEADDSIGSQHFLIVRGAAVERPVEIVAPPPFVPEPEEPEVENFVDEAEAEDAAPESGHRARDGEGDDRGGRRRRRRRKRRGGRDREDAPQTAHEAIADEAGDAETDEDEDGDEAVETSEETRDDTGEREPRKRRRGKRGGRRNREARTEDGDAVTEAPDGAATDEDDAAQEAAEPVASAPEEAPAVVQDAEPEAVEEPAKPKRARRAPKRKAAEAAEPETAKEPEAVAEAVTEARVEDVAEPAPVDDEVKPARRRAATGSEEPVLTSAAEAQAAEDAKPKRGGWWQRKGFF